MQNAMNRPPLIQTCWLLAIRRILSLLQIVSERRSGMNGLAVRLVNDPVCAARRLGVGGPSLVKARVAAVVPRRPQPEE